MQQFIAIAAFGLQRMAEGMAEIEQRACPPLALVGAHDPGLGGAGDGDGVAPGGEIAIERAAP